MFWMKRPTLGLWLLVFLGLTVSLPSVKGGEYDYQFDSDLNGLTEYILGTAGTDPLNFTWSSAFGGSFKTYREFASNDESVVTGNTTINLDVGDILQFHAVQTFVSSSEIFAFSVCNGTIAELTKIQDHPQCNQSFSILDYDGNSVIPLWNWYGYGVHAEEGYHYFGNLSRLNESTWEYQVSTPNSSSSYKGNFSLGGDRWVVVGWRIAALEQVHEAYLDYLTLGQLAPVEEVVNWDGYTPYNQSVMTSLEPIFFNHTYEDSLNCSLFGVTDGDNICNGTVLSCDSFEDNESCVAQQGCYWMSSNGTAPTDWVFRAEYDNSYLTTDGEPPITQTGTSFGDGVVGQAVLINDSDVLRYNISNNLNLTKGTIAFYVMSLTSELCNLTSGDKIPFIYENLVSNEIECRFRSSSYHFWFEYDSPDSNGRVATDDCIGWNKGEWHHIAFTYDINTDWVELYWDGVFIGNNTNSMAQINSTVGYFDVGQRNGGSQLGGYVDELTIYDRVLGSSEILALNNSEFASAGCSGTASLCSVFNFSQGACEDQSNCSFFTGKLLTNYANKSGVVGNQKQNFSDYVLSNGNYELYVTCDNVSSSHKFITINGSMPVIDFLFVDNFLGRDNFTDGGVFEYVGGEWNLSVNVINYDYFNLSLYNNSGLEKSQVGNLVMSLEDEFFSSFDSKNPYNFSVWSNNIFGTAFDSILFYINDTVLPMCVGNLNDVEVVEGSVFGWAVNCTDEFFFSFNMSCDSGYGFYEENINNQSYFFNGSFQVVNDSVCLYEFCDGHTKRSLEDLVVKKDLENKTLEVEGKRLVLSHSVYDIELVKKYDRYVFCFDFESGAKLNYVSVDIPDGCYHIDSGYVGHLVCPAERLWWDFVNPAVGVDVIGDKVYFDLRKVKGNRVCFDSVGKFNCVSGVQNINSVALPYNRRGVIGQEFVSVQQALFYVFLLVFWLTLVIILFTVKGKAGDTVQIFNIFQFFIGFVAGFGWFKFSFIIGFSVIFVAIAIFIGLILNKRW